MRKNGKKLLSLVLALVMVLVLCPTAALAAALDTNPLTLTVDSGTVSGSNIQWKVSKDGTDYILTLSGSGEVYAFAYEDWQKYNRSIKKIVINEGITSIVEYAFRYCPAESISLPASLTTFRAHTGTLSSPLMELDKLEEVIVAPGNNTYCSIDGVMFTKDRSTLVIYPKNRAGAYAVPDGTVRIGQYAFSNRIGLISVTIPDSVTVIEESAFRNCLNLTNVDIGRNVTSIKDHSFDNCEMLTSVTIPASVTEIGCFAFYTCDNLDTVTIPEGVTGIGEWAFAYCRSLTSITIPGGVASIDIRVFDGCTNLTSVVISNGVSNIKEAAFHECENLTSIYIPASVTSIERWVFASSGLRDVYYAGTEGQWKSVKIGGENGPLPDAAMHYGASPRNVPIPVPVKDFPFYPNSVSGSEKVHIDWSLSLFKDDSTVRNNELAKAGLVLSAAAEHSAESVEQILRDMGYQHLRSRNYTEEENGVFQSGATFAHVQKNGTHYFAIVGRGTSSDADFKSDLASLVEGFSVTAATVEAQFKLFARDECGVDLNANRNNCVFFVTGHSLGGAVANIIVQNLNKDRIGFNTKNIFGYTYASPKTSLVPSILSNQNIHNFLNISDSGIDMVPQLPPSRIFRYGRDISLENTKPAEFEEQFKRLSGVSYQDMEDGLKPHYVQTYMALLLADTALDPSVINTMKTYLRIACPVDVEICGADNQLVASVINNVVTNNEPEKVAVCVEDEAKYICFQDDTQYTVHLTGTGSGIMDYTIQSLDVGACEVKEEKVFSHVALTDGKQMISSVNVEDSAGIGTDISQVALYVLDSNGTPEKEVLPDGKGTEIPYEPKPAAVKFTDVPSDAWYYDAVQWAVENGITTGTSATTFSPDVSCTRAQIVTLLWRAAGSPGASGSNSFADVPQGSYYYDAVLWAVSQGITTGTSTTTFSPDVVCTRAQAVTFLHRAAGFPATAGTSPFTDVVSGSYYADAVQWAVSKGIVNGTTPTTFSPEQTCTRAQIVTLLYRDRAGKT